MESKDTFIKTFPFVWIYTGIIAVIFYYFIGADWGVSFVLGSATSLMTMSMLYKNSKRVVESDKTTAQKLAVKNYALRYFFYVVVLVVSGYFDQLEIFATAFGLFSFKIVFYMVFLFESRGVKK
jgi:hypothetical protein